MTVSYTSKEALELLTAASGDWVWAARTLSDQAAIGRIEVTAARVIVRHEIAGIIEQQDDCFPPHELWEDWDTWSRPDWYLGTFHAMYGVGQRVFATGVVFDRSAVDALLTALGTEPLELTPAKDLRKPAPEAELREWFEGYCKRNVIEMMDIDEGVFPAAVAFFAENRVTRSRIRDLVSGKVPDRKPGRKPSAAK